MALATGALALAAFAALRPLLYGASVSQVGAAWVFLALWVILPGWLAWRWLRPEGDDGIAQLALGWALGHAMELLAHVGLKYMGASGAFAWWPIVSLPLAVLARRPWSRARASAPAIGGRSALLLFGVLALAIARARQAHVSNWWRDFDLDVLFHASNAASLGRGLPLENPRIAGEAFNYHYFSYSTVAGLRDVFGVPVHDALERVATSAGPVLLVLVVFTLARNLARSATAGVIAAALVALHADLGFNLVRLFGARGSDFDLNSYLEYGVYRSPSMVLGLVLFAAMAHIVTLELRDARSARGGSLAVLAVLAVAGAGTKGTVMPVAVGAGAALVAGMLAFRWWSSRSRAGSSPAGNGSAPAGTRAPGSTRTSSAPVAKPLLLLAALAVPAAPMTLLLAFGGGSHAEAMFRVAPWHALTSSGAFAAVAQALGTTAPAAPRWLEWCLAPFWVLVYFGPCLAASVLLLARRAAWEPAVVWLSGAALASAVLAFGLGAPCVSELFFADLGHVALAVVASVFFVQASRRRAFAVALVFGLMPATGLALDVAAQLRRDVLPRPAPIALVDQYADGMTWVREHTPRDAVLLAGTTEILLSSQAERRVFHETERTNPMAMAASWERVNGRWSQSRKPPVLYPAREELCERFRAAPSAEILRAARLELARTDPRLAAVELYAIVDRMSLSHQGELGTHWELEPVGDRRIAAPEVELVFENPALRVYRLAPDPR